jgi:hypothetical protein
MTKSLLTVIALLFFQSLLSQEIPVLEQIRRDFQEIRDGDDIERLLEVTVDREHPDASVIEAYQAASTCMMAEYVFSPIKKLKYFNEGRDALDEVIDRRKTVESVYCRLLVQLNVPRILNYHDDIEDDIDYLQLELPKSKIDLDYKNTMINNLVTLAGKDELKKSLLEIDLTGEFNKS